MFFQAINNDTGSQEEKSILGKVSVELLNSFESEATKIPTLNDYNPRMRSVSDTFYAWLPEILDQGKINAAIGV